MKVLKLEFTYYDACDWESKTIEITALDKKQIHEAFLIETVNINPSKKHNPLKWEDAQNKTRDCLWDFIKGDIKDKELEFPLVEYLKN